MSEMERVAVIVVTYNRKRLLARCLEALYRQSVPPRHICVVDNASTDDTGAFLQRCRQERPDTLTYLRLPENRGGSGGFRCGFAWALEQPDWDWLLVMDDDAAPAPDYTQKLLDAAREHPDVKCLAGTEYVGNTDRIAVGSRRIIQRESTLRAVPAPIELYQQQTFYVDTATFVGLLLHRGVVERVGCPDDSFFIYYDDTDYCLRLRPYTRILQVTDARIVHREDYEKDVVVEGGQAWRRYYLFRNEMVIKKRYIRNWFLRYGWLIKTYLLTVRRLLREEAHPAQSVWLVTRAASDALWGRLGKKRDLP